VQPASRCATGAVEARQVVVTGEEDDEPLVLRRITIRVDEPTAREIHLLTNQPEEVSAARCAELYHARWSVEAAFGELTLSLCGEIDTLCYPKAALLAYAIALVTYNLLAVVKAAMCGAWAAVDSVSTYYLAHEATATWQGLEIALPEQEWQRRYGGLAPAKLAAALVELARHTKLARHRKHPRGPKKKPPREPATPPTSAPKKSSINVNKDES